MNKKQRGLLGLSLAGALLLPTTGAVANEVHTYGVANFGGAGQCGNSDMTHSVHTATAQVVANYFTSLKNAGQWTDVRTINNMSVRADLWTDRNKVNSLDAQDTQLNLGVDDADVMFIHTHGGHSTSAPARSWLSMGSNADNCSAVTTSHMSFGNVTSVGTGKLDIAVVKACQSGDYEVWKSGGYRTALTTTNSNFTMWNAFHGDSSCGNFVKDYLEDYVQGSKWDGVGENWVDEAYDWGLIYDDCPVSIVFGSSKSARTSMYANGGWKDRKATGSKTGSTIFYVRGCNPDNGIKLPN